MEARNNGSRGRGGDVSWKGGKEGREGKEAGIGRWREGGSDHCSCTKKGKPTKCEIASTLSFSR